MQYLVLIFSIFTITSSCAVCQCGYTVNNNSAIFTNRLETDFLHVGNLSKDTSNAWLAQAYFSTPESSHGPYVKLAQIGNVVPNPLSSTHDWGGAGIYGDSPGLQLWVHKPKPNGPSSFVPIAEIVSLRSDILYGSFRVAMRTTHVNGTCAAFFTYFDDTSEIDVELLSRQQDVGAHQGKVNFVIQSPQNAALGYVPPSSSNFGLENLPNDPATTYNEYRVDWFPDHVAFFVNGISLKTMTENVPTRPARIHMIHWSDGNPGWSGGPPESDAVLTVSYVKAYFNSSIKQLNQRHNCNACVIPDVKLPPNPMGTDGNVTGRTFFFQNSQVASQATMVDWAGADWSSWSLVAAALVYSTGVLIWL